VEEKASSLGVRTVETRTRSLLSSKEDTIVVAAGKREHGI